MLHFQTDFLILLPHAWLITRWAKWTAGGHRKLLGCFDNILLWSFPQSGMFYVIKGPKEPRSSHIVIFERHCSNSPCPCQNPFSIKQIPTLKEKLGLLLSDKMSTASPYRVRTLLPTHSFFCKLL